MFQALLFSHNFIITFNESPRGKPTGYHVVIASVFCEAISSFVF